MSRKITIIIIICVLVIIGVGVYLIIHRGQSSSTVQDQSTQNVLPQAKDIDPLGSNSATSTNGLGSAIASGSDALIKSAVRLVSAPTAGGTIYYASTTPTARYIDRLTGNISDINLLNGDTTKVSNTTIPGVADSFWATANTGIMRYFNADTNSIVNYAFSVQEASSTGLTSGKILSSSISEIALAPTKTSALFMNTDGTALAASVDGTKSQKIFSSPLTEWQVAWPSSSIIALTTKPSAVVPGYLYFLNPKTSSITPVLSGINGLTTLVNPTGTKILYFNANTNSLNIFDVAHNTSTSTNLSTLPEKCVWSIKDPNSAYCATPQDTFSATLPDDWYQGSVSFADTMYRVDATTGTASLLASLSLSGNGPVDATHLSLDAQEKYILLTNKKDSSLWVFKLQ